MNMHLLIIVTSLLFVFIFNSFFVVQQQTCVIVERLGKFQRIAKAGLNFKIPFLETIKSTMSLRIHQLDVDVETKTKDNVFVRMIVVVQYKILETKIFEACYTLHDPVEQIKAFVFDLVRAQIPLMELDDVFSKKDDVANAVRNELRIPMSDFGYEIIKTLVTDIDPDAQVKTAMNEI
ncbi:MAG: hypothetical protein LBF70_01475, partial [Holosporales bacterium]|nr:hypothetical protein [Holosporales bacterium]